MGHCNHSILVDAKIMVSKNCPIIGEHVAVNFMAQKVTIATWPAWNTLNFNLTHCFLEILVKTVFLDILEIFSLEMGQISYDLLKKGICNMAACFFFTSDMF